MFVHSEAALPGPRPSGLYPEGNSARTILFFVSLHINHHLIQGLLNFDLYRATNYPVQFENSRGNTHKKVRRTRRLMDAPSWGTNSYSWWCAEAGQALLWIRYLKSWLFEAIQFKILYQRAGGRLLSGAQKRKWLESYLILNWALLGEPGPCSCLGIWSWLNPWGLSVFLLLFCFDKCILLHPLSRSLSWLI